MCHFDKVIRVALVVLVVVCAVATSSVASRADAPPPAADKTAAPAQAPAAPAPPPAASPAQAPPAPKPDQEITPDQMKGVSFEGLTEAQKQLAFSILSDNRCDCSCGMTLARCRVKDTTCNRSLGLANQVLDLVKAGKSRDEIVKAVLSPPSKYVQFDLPAGEAPSVGPKDARVTILYYLDHQ